MKYIVLTGLILVLFLSCTYKKDASAILVDHLKNTEKIFKINQNDIQKLSNELSTYAQVNITEMQNGVKALTEKMKKVKENPLESFDLIAKVTEISAIIVSIRTKYGHLLDDPEIKKAFTQFVKMFDSIQNLEGIK